MKAGSISINRIGEGMEITYPDFRVMLWGEPVKFLITWFSSGITEQKHSVKGQGRIWERDEFDYDKWYEEEKKILEAERAARREREYKQWCNENRIIKERKGIEYKEDKIFRHLFGLKRGDK